MHIYYLNNEGQIMKLVIIKTPQIKCPIDKFLWHQMMLLISYLTNRTKIGMRLISAQVQIRWYTSD